MRKLLIFIWAIFLIPVLFPQTKAIAASPPTISIDAPASASGVITATVNYSFPDDNGKLSILLYPPGVPGFVLVNGAFISRGTTDSITLTLDSTNWLNGATTITAWAYYINIPSPNVTDSASIATNNTPGLTILSPGGSVQGVMQFNLSYRFPSTSAGYGLFWLYLDDRLFEQRQVPLSLTSPTSGNLELTYDTTSWPDGTHTIKVIANMGACFWCGNIRPNPNTQEVSIVTNNLPSVTIVSPSGTVRGVVNASINYNFPSTYYAQPGRISLERKTFFGAYVTIASKSVTLSPAQATSGTWDFTFDASNWLDGNYTLRAKASYRTTNYYYKTITVANESVEASLDKETPQDKTTQVAEPINVANGNMFTTQTDILIPSPEIPLELSRTYNSQDDFKGEFGYGWRSNFDINLTEQADDSVIEVDEKGVYTIYTKQPDGTYQASAGKYSQLTKNSGTFTLLRKHGRKLYFDTSGKLVKIEERNGHAINILRTPAGVISEVSDAAGRKLAFTFDDQGRIAQVEDPTERIFQYEYDSNGDLVKTIDPLEQETLYHYDNHNLIRQTDANGNVLCFTYDTSDRAYHSWQYGNNNEVTLTFDPDHKTTTTTDSLGNIAQYEYNDYGLVTKITDTQNNTQLFSWDDNLNKTSATDKNGHTTILTYDDRGNLLTIKDPLNHITTFTYTSSASSDFDLISSVTDALNNKTEYFYDLKGNLTQVKDALGNTTNYTYDTASGQLDRIKDANNNITNFDYDIYGNLSRITDALGDSTNFTLDMVGNTTRITDAQGNSTQFSYNHLNQLTQITYPDGSQVSYTYDAVGNLVAFTDPNHNTTAYAYDVVNRLTQVTDALGNITQYDYDSEGNRAAITDANSNQTQYFYDSLNRLIKTLDPLGNQTLFNHDPNGNLISKTDANSNTIYYTYDANNRLTHITYPDASTVAYTYDALARRTSITDSTGTTTYSHDPLSRLTQVDGPQNNDAISYLYDKLGNRIQMTDQDGGITIYNYDSLNRLINLSDPQYKTAAYSYDSRSNLTHVQYPNHTQANYVFDNLNRLVSLTNRADANIISSSAYQYNPSGMRTQITLANNDYILYSYDALNQLTQEKRYNQNNELQYASTYNYDSVGNRLIQGLNFQEEGFKIKDLPQKATLEYTHNPDNQLTQLKIYKIDKKGKPKLHKIINYLYDQNGNLIQELAQDKESLLQETKTYTYDYENRLTQVKIIKSDATETKLFDFTYDGLGRRISQATTESALRFYLYDGLNTILERDQTNQTLTTYTRGLSYGGGIGSIIGIRTANEVGGERELYYHYDGLGSVTTLTDTKAYPKISYTYDTFGNILKQKGSRNANPYTFSTKEQDASGLIYFGARYYDPRVGRWITKDPLGIREGVNLYMYCNNNPTNWIDPLGLKVYIGGRVAFGPGSHTAIILVPDNEEDFINDHRFTINAITGKLEADISAGPKGDVLTQYSYHTDRLNSSIMKVKPIRDPYGRSDTQLIKDILNSADRYTNDLYYDPFALGGCYNSNSYTRGILKASGINNPPLPNERLYPGWTKPIPLKDIKK